ncbi:MAG: adenylate/guanylate cyclase domain-containing protein [Hyphomicrobiaceae bacterium]
MAVIAWPRADIPPAKAEGADVLPQRVRNLVRAQEDKSERLIGWVQLSLIVLFGTLYFLAPRPPDADVMFEPVPWALAGYAALTVGRLYLSYRRPLPGWVVLLSILLDTVLLIGLIAWFHIQYRQPAPFTLKIPMFIYIFVFISLRGLRFDPRYVLSAGLFAALGWAGLTLWVIEMSGPEAITRQFTEYLNGNRILIGAEFEKIFTLLMVTAVLTLAVMRARQTLVTAVSEQAASREIRRFLPGGVADAVTRAETAIGAGRAEEREAAIVMLDIRGFTRFSTTVSPHEVVQMLTSLHSRIVPIVESHGGVIDKFLGDGVMATFGAVEPSRTAAADALRALDAIMIEAGNWQRSLVTAGSGSALIVNGAAASGTIVFATLGTADRLEYTVIGEAVNLAAKLEKQNKIEETRALVAAATYDLALAHGYRPPTPHERRHNRSVAGTAVPLDLVVLA